jgi:hypothetical protein
MAVQRERMSFEDIIWLSRDVKIPWQYFWRVYRVFEHLPSVDVQLVLHTVGVVVQLGDAVSAFNL